MNLNNFKKIVNKKILERGHDYYLEGNITEVFKKRENEYLFLIEGTYNYEVVVKLDEAGEIIDSRCDCPYDFGPVCKHEAAAYFELYEIIYEHPEREVGLTRAEDPSTIQDILRNLSKEELISIIMDITNTDEVLANTLMMKYSHGDSELESCQKLIDEIVRKYTGHNALIAYRDTASFTSELETILHKARNTEDLSLASDISLLLLEEAVYSFQYADDSSGDIGHLVGQTLKTIEEIAMESKGSACWEEVFLKLLTFSKSEVFDGWEDYRVDLLTICLLAADEEAYRENLRSAIESLLKRDWDDDYSKYANESLLQLLYDVIEQYGTKEEAAQFVNDHLQFSSFRKRLLNNYLEKQDYQKVIEIALDGEEQDQELLGLLIKWKNFRYKAYQSLGLRQEQQMLAKELFLKGDFDYYYDLKDLSESHDLFYEELKQELKSAKGRYDNHLFLKLLEVEDDQEELMKFIRENTAHIEKYAGKLAAHYEKEVLEIYRNYIFAEARLASNRSHYREICRKLKRYEGIAGKQKQKAIVDELMKLQKRKPAFIDELGSLLSSKKKV
ncbi:hypothetical protein FZC78_10365 [Rossellomorea vietnamensis]|uniref:SWIM-type domain-containing protein n=1 Tax=Rossellomorea vietnamensis TaxID=218284 RepID=A0A5D4NTT1_9BACI|nr:hypothetical protein [Rossellomorea vietnamensis]TYS17024.1 hypothetical protein FZC78_10365 [Rossellomorea vietnamensis]